MVELSRGVRQGCPLSPYLFILSVEIMAETIQSKQEIRGISINSNEIKLSQYADDMTLILDGSEQSLQESLKLIDIFGGVSGLRLNRKKTAALWIGTKAGSDFQLLPEKGFKWPRNKVKALGVWLSTDPDITISQTTMINWKKLIRFLAAGNFKDC